MGIPTVPKTLKYKWLYTGHVLRMKIQWGFPIPTSKLIALLCLLLQVADRLNSHLVLAAKRYDSLGMSEVMILLKLKLKQQSVLKYCVNSWVVVSKYMGGKLILNGPNCYPPPTPFCENHNHCITQKDMHERVVMP